ncbi:amidohydrolase family protein [Streptomyces sp. CC210A]|uniref:N-acyl-D-amino-acid deacylase family protein n=1 Tax=Streptomyces sp. CC210A TaxID=2898184 RepID=UPI001F42747F|nr:D-aminoacylase [Streptomyces sp. CC210A]
MDLVIRGATVVDGSGSPGYRADVGIAGGRITAVRRSGDRALGARRALDAHGLVLCPGFVDMHAHSDLALLSDPAHEAKAAQGVTLEVLGQDGLSYAPVDDATLAGVRAAVAGWNGDGGDVPGGLDWRTVGEYLDRLDRGFDGEGIAVNAAYLVPQGTVRAYAVGWEDRPATDAEVLRMRRLVAEGLEQGAVGMSSGLTYTPGMYADGRELAALCRVVAEYGGYWCPHHRSYGAGALDAYREVLGLARDAGCALHLAHATLNFPGNAGRAPELLALLDAALADGADVSLDTYPYTAGSTTLAALLPGWAHAGGPDALLARLRDGAAAERIRHAVEVTGSDGCHGVPVDWSTVEVSGVSDPALARFVGTRVPDWPAARRLLLADRLGTTVLQHVGHEDNVRTIMRHRVHTGGSDGILRGAKPHPRAYGTFPHYLGHYVRELGVLPLEEAVAHLTSRPAARLRLPDRGLVREGYRADLVLFDPATVAAGATYAQPRALPAGVPHVLIDGRFVVRDGRRTDVLAGRAVRRAPAGRCRRPVPARPGRGAVT